MISDSSKRWLTQISVGSVVVLLGCGDGDAPGSHAGGGTGGAMSTESSSRSTSGAVGEGGGGPAGSGGGEGYCETFVDKVRSCALVTDGLYLEGCVSYGDGAEACEVACMSRAECVEVTEFFCASEGALLDCLAGCIGLVPVTCSDGSRHSYDYRCDGVADCDDGSDEAECPSTRSYKCRNVDQFVADSVVCNGTADCSDSSDELAGCDAQFSCTDGDEVSSALYCDGIADCVDASDEPTGCAELVCPEEP